MRRIVSAFALFFLVGCGVPKEQLDSKSLEAENYKRQYQDAAGRAAAQDSKIAELTKKVGELQAQLDDSSKQRQQMEDALGQSEAKQRDLEGKLNEANALNQELAANSKKLQEAKEALEKKSSEYDALAKSLKEEIQSGKVELSELRGRMTVKMKDKILFSSGSTKLNKEGVDALKKVAEALKAVQGKIIRVEGHTDNVPVDPKGPFASNWELSTTRSLEVVKLLSDNGVPSPMLSAVGYGEFQPIASNSTPNGRSLNRRIEIVLAPADQAPGAVKGANTKTTSRGAP
ncbi:MAG: OmpA family protein [Myxococcaceae bacterium]